MIKALDTNGLLLLPPATSFYWSRIPGKFVFKTTGKEFGHVVHFDGTVREWYETLVETIIDVANSIESRTHLLANTCVVSENVAVILECSMLYRPDLNVGFPHPPGLIKVGVLNDRFNIYRDQDVVGNMILIGYEDNDCINSDENALGSINVLDMSIR